jgi:hypothetical protein
MSLLREPNEKVKSWATWNLVGHLRSEYLMWVVSPCTRVTFDQGRAMKKAAEASGTAVVPDARAPRWPRAPDSMDRMWCTVLRHIEPRPSLLTKVSGRFAPNNPATRRSLHRAFSIPFSSHLQGRLIGGVDGS